MQSISIQNEGLISTDLSVNMNVRTYNHYFRTLKMLSTVMYKWEGIPNTIPNRFIENSLFYHGKLAFFYDEEFGYMVTKCNQQGELNIYDEPIAYNCYGSNGYSKNKNAEDVVIIRNNFDEIPTRELIELFCIRLTQLERTMDINIDQQKTPTIILCEESQRLTLRNLYMQREENEPIIFGNKALDLKGVTSLKTDSPFVADKLNDLKNKKMIECLDMLGINNANTQKKERLNTEEVNSNNQLLNLRSDISLAARELACIEIFEKFGIDITVELREEQQENNNIVSHETIEGGENE